MSSLNTKGKILVLAILVMAVWMCLRHRKVPGIPGPLPAAKPEEMYQPRTPIVPCRDKPGAW